MSEKAKLKFDSLTDEEKSLLDAYVKRQVYYQKQAGNTNKTEILENNLKISFLEIGNLEEVIKKQKEYESLSLRQQELEDFKGIEAEKKNIGMANKTIDRIYNEILSGKIVRD